MWVGWVGGWLAGTTHVYQLKLGPALHILHTQYMLWERATPKLRITHPFQIRIPIQTQNFLSADASR